jgi:hypothetical protein
MRPRWLWLAVVVTTVGSVGLLWATGIPLGVPGEWTWPRIPFSAETLAGWCAAGLAGALYVGLAWLGQRRLARAGRAEACGWLSALVVAAFTWLCVVQSAVITRGPPVISSRRGTKWRTPASSSPGMRRCSPSATTSTLARTPRV